MKAAWGLMVIMVVFALAAFPAAALGPNCGLGGEVGLRAVNVGPSIFITDVGVRLMAPFSLEAGFSAAKIEGQDLSGFHFSLGHPFFDVFRGVILFGENATAEYNELKVVFPLCPTLGTIVPYAGFGARALSLDIGNQHIYDERYLFIVGGKIMARQGCYFFEFWGELLFSPMRDNACNGCFSPPMNIECGIRILF